MKLTFFIFLGAFCLIYYYSYEPLAFSRDFALVVANIDFSLDCGMERYTVV